MIELFCVVLFSLVSSQSCSDVFEGFSAMQLLQENPPLEIGTSENMNVEGFGVDLTGLWWMDGNPSGGSLASFAGCTYSGDGTWPKTLSCPMNEAGKWSFEYTETGETLLYLNLWEIASQDMIFEFTDDKKATITHWSVVTRLVNSGTDTEFVGTDNPDLWLRPLPQVSEDATYYFKRIIDANGTPTAYWNDFVAYYSAVNPQLIQLKYASDDTCYRQCSMVRSCDNCTIACENSPGFFTATEDENLRVLIAAFLTYLRSPQAQTLCDIISTLNSVEADSFFTESLAQFEETLQATLGLSVEEASALLSSITTPEEDDGSDSGFSITEIAGSLSPEELENFGKAIGTFDLNCRATLWERGAPRSMLETFEEAMTPIIFGMAYAAGRQTIFRWLHEVAGQDIYPFRLGFAANSWASVSAIAGDPGQLRENYIGAVPAHPQCFHWNVPILLSSTNPEHARTREVFYNLMNYDPNDLEIPGDEIPSTEALKSVFIDNLWRQVFKERLPVWYRRRISQYLGAGLVCGLGEYVINFLSTYVDDKYGGDNIEFLRELITKYALDTQVGQDLGDDLPLVVDGLLFAGAVGTWHLLGYTWGYLSQGGPNAIAAFDFDPVNFVKESARFNPPVTSATSLYKEDTEITFKGKTFTAPAGTPLQYMIAEANFDETVWDDPSTFNPLRDVSNSMSWNGIQSEVEAGTSPRACPGYQMSAYIVTDILKHFRPALTDTSPPECVDNDNEIDSRLMNAAYAFDEDSTNRCALLTAIEGSCPVDICCESCPAIEAGDSDEEILAHKRFMELSDFQGRIFGIDLTRENFDEYVETEYYWTEDAVVTIPVAGEYHGKEAIIEYFLLQNKEFSDERHYFFPGYATVSGYEDVTETSMGVWQTGSNCVRPASTEIEECTPINFYMHLTYQNSTTVIPDTLLIEFEYIGVQNMVSTFRDNAYLCSVIMDRCTGSSAQFDSQEACQEFMNTLPMTLEEEGCPLLAGPTLSCRHTHLILTQELLRPEIHCAHTGPFLPDPNGKVKCSIADCNAPTVSTVFETEEPTYYAPDATLLESMGKLIARGPSETRFEKIGRRAVSILQDAKNKGLDPDIDVWLRHIKRISKQEYTENRFIKMETKYQKIMDALEASD